MNDVMSAVFAVMMLGSHGGFVGAVLLTDLREEPEDDALTPGIHRVGDWNAGGRRTASEAQAVRRER